MLTMLSCRFESYPLHLLRKRVGRGGGIGRRADLFADRWQQLARGYSSRLKQQRHPSSRGLLTEHVSCRFESDSPLICIRHSPIAGIVQWQNARRENHQQLKRRISTVDNSGRYNLPPVWWVNMRAALLTIYPREPRERPG